MEQEYARRYGDFEQWHWWFQGRAKIVETVLRRELSAPGPVDILSVGCGPASGLQRLLPFAGRGGSVTGLDIEPAHAHPRPEGTCFVVGGAEKPPFPDRSFDVVLALDVLEHMDDDLVGLQQATRLLRPGGFLLITVPAFPFLWGDQDIISQHKRRYTKQAFISLLRRGGLRNFEVSYFNTLLFPVAAAIRLARRRRRATDRPRTDLEGSHPGILNSTLSWIFGAERHLLNRVPMPAGVSLMATYRNGTDEGRGPDA